VKRVLLRERAHRGISDAVDHYPGESDEAVARAFIDALEATFRQIARFPGVGSPRYGIELDIADLRSLPLRRYPFLVFYVERTHGIEILRVLHAHRDIPPLLR